MPDTSPKITAPDCIVRNGPMLFVGIRKYFRFEDRGGVPALWQTFAPHIGTMPTEVQGAIYGLCLGPADGNDEFGFDDMPAVEVRSLDDLCERVSSVRRAGRTWAIFQHREHVSSIGLTCGAAGEWFAQSGRAPPSGTLQMIERYGAGFDPRTGSGGCEVWLPLAS